MSLSAELHALTDDELLSYYALTKKDLERAEHWSLQYELKARLDAIVVVGKKRGFAMRNDDALV